MMLKLDRQVGDLIATLEADGLDDNTVVFLCGDNGGEDYFADEAHPRGFFAPNVDPKTGVEFRGQKRHLWEGGLRVPTMARWPGQIEAGRSSDLLWYFPDVFPTLVELARGIVPDGVDGISILPTLLGEGEQKHHEALYWEFGGQTAVRLGDWKAVRYRPKQPWRLYDLSNDISETTDVADRHPDIVERAKAIAKREHTPAQPGEIHDRELAQKDGWVPVKKR